MVFTAICRTCVVRSNGSRSNLPMFDLFAELSGLTAEVREHRLVMLRVAEALERISPPVPVPPDDAASRLRRDSPVAKASDESQDQVHHLAESPEEWMSRMD